MAGRLLDTIHQILGQVGGTFLRLTHDVLCLTREGAIRHEGIETRASRWQQDPAGRNPSSLRTFPLSRISNRGCSLGPIDHPLREFVYVCHSDPFLESTDE